MKNPPPLAVVAVLAAILVPRVEAVAMTYGDLGSFLTAAASPLQFESFESLQASNQLDAGAFQLSGFEVTHSFAPDADLGAFDTPFAGLGATDGLNFLAYQAGAGTELIFRFSTPVNAFALDLSDWGDYQQGQGTLGFGSDAGHALTIANSPRTNGNLLFFGIIDPDSSFTEVRLSNSLPGEGFGVDAVRHGLTGPSGPPFGVPDGGASWLLLGCGTAGLGLASRFARRPRPAAGGRE